MFDIGWGELIIIGIVALIAIGPKELPAALRMLGQYLGKLKRMSSEFQNQFRDAMREAEAADLKKQVNDLESSVGNFMSLERLGETNAEKINSVEPTTKSANQENGLAPVDMATESPTSSIDQSETSLSPSQRNRGQ